MTTSLAELSNTRIYVGDGTFNDKYVHVLAYQNTAISNGPNAIILPFPTSVSMGQENVIDTRSFPDFLNDITDASKLLTLGGRGFESLSEGVEVFDVGSYTIVLADNVLLATKAIDCVPQEKRPTISDSFVKGYSELYPNQPVAICCWNGSIKAEPLLWWYKPTNKDVLFIPTMDAHDGNAPNTKAWVKADHIVSVGSNDDSKIANSISRGVKYSDEIPDFVKGLLPNRVLGTQVKGLYANGDMFVKVDSLKKKAYKYENLPKVIRGLTVDDTAGSLVTMVGWS
jgi:hypothetical protein